MLDQATRLRIENIDWIIEHAPKIERGEWARRAIELLEYEKTLIAHHHERQVALKTQADTFAKLADTMYGIVEKTIKHERGCEQDWSTDWFDRDEWDCAACEMLAMTRTIFDTEKLPEHFSWMSERVCDAAYRLQG